MGALTSESLYEGAVGAVVKGTVWVVGAVDREDFGVAIKGAVGVDTWGVGTAEAADKGIVPVACKRLLALK
jgi:hypothetical protein